ncbi:hypothetical protein MKW98_016095 [Papaver atlanticum]|uniref:Uncharacterized protein n=1 Tax=Papaver atlanticum TaxID=357466 RepID=A0AAD4T5R6_9MAGN|nr:hypothetical protein MKW98_016095 [Papaver atlanticum]
MSGVGSAMEINDDSSGWTLVTGKKSSSLKGKNRVVVNSKSLCEVEAKVFSIEIGYGMKKGLFLIREQKGSYSSSLWVSSKALAWILSKFTEETKEQAGEFLKLMGPNKNGGNIDLFFPSGKYGVGGRSGLSILKIFIRLHLVLSIRKFPFQRLLHKPLTLIQTEMRCGYQFLVFLSFYGIPELMNHWVLNVGD